MKYRTNQTDWMVQVKDAGEKSYTDFWGVSTWSKSRKAGLIAGRECVRFNRGHDNMPRWRLKLIRHKDIKSLLIPIN